MPVRPHGLKYRTAAASLLGLAIGLTATPAQAADKAPKRPNIAIIIMDDVGIDTTSDMYPGLIKSIAKQYGPQGANNPDYLKIEGRPASTPILNAFAAKGMTFRQAWAQPFCSPTRASLLTGLFASKTEVRDYTNWLTQQNHSIAQDLKTAGYSTAMFGKWHLAGLNQYPGLKPKEASFDLFRGNMNGAIEDYWDYSYQVQDAGTPAGQIRTEKAPVNALPGIKPSSYASVTQVADALNWMNGAKKAKPDNPWFMWMAFNLVHITPGASPTFVPNEDTLDKVTADEIRACGGQFGTVKIGNCSAAALNRAMTNSMDTLIGKLLDGIYKADPNTYVIILGDNGTPMYGRPNVDFIDNLYIHPKGRAKGTGYEAGVRIPLAIRGPGIKPGSSDAVVHVADLFSTMLDFGKVPVPKAVSNRAGTGTVAVDGKSLSPLLFQGKKEVRDPVHDYIVSETSVPILSGGNPTGQSAEHHVLVRNATYKLLCIRKAGAASACQYYNLVKDPLEEYPLKMPAQCSATVSVTFAATDEAANYCFLRNAVQVQSGL